MSVNNILKYLDLKSIIGLTVESIKGESERKNSKYIIARYILFSDKKTYIELEEQGLSCHDYSVSAKEIVVYESKNVWAKLNNLKDANLF